MREVKQERSGWRDEALSQRHRDWGWDCPAVDIDFLLVEYDIGKAKALVEYKNEHAAPQFLNRPSYRALIDLADRAELPFFAVRYASNFSNFFVVPANLCAKNIFGKRHGMTEIEYVDLLYCLRGYAGIPDKVRAILEVR